MRRLLCVDVTGAGRAGQRGGCRFSRSSSHKWLLGSHGLAVVHAVRLERLRTADGIRFRITSPDRFVSFSRWLRGRLMAGMPNFAIYALREGLNAILAEGPSASTRR